MSKDKFNKRFMDSEITLTNKEAKHIMKKIRSLENRGILLKETTKKIVRKEGYLMFSLH